MRTGRLHRTNVHLDRGQRWDLHQLARKRKTTAAELVRQAIDELLRRALTAPAPRG